MLTQVEEAKALAMKMELLNMITHLTRDGKFDVIALVFSPLSADLLERWVRTQGAHIPLDYSISGGGPLLGYDTKVNPFLYGHAVRPVLQPLYLVEFDR